MTYQGFQQMIESILTPDDSNSYPEQSPQGAEDGQNELGCENNSFANSLQENMITSKVTDFLQYLIDNFKEGLISYNEIMNLVSKQRYLNNL